MKKILVAQFKHETNSFCPAPADMTAYRNRVWDVGQEMFDKQRGLGTELGGFLAVLENRGDIQLIPSVSAEATPSGPVTAEVYEAVRGYLAAALEEHGPVDGVLIAFHGAMVSDGHDDGEGDLLEWLRSLVGWEIPVVASMDLHANVTAKMARCATALVPYENYPHTDMYETGCKAAQIMADTLDGKLVPKMAYRRIPFLLPLFPSDYPEMQALYREAAECQNRPGACSVRFTHGFFPADIEEMGMTVMAVADGDQALADELADRLEKKICDSLDTLKREYPELDEALDRAILPGEGPVVLADASDNPGAGGLGDTTHLLRRVLERGITGSAVAAITDPESVAACERAGVGAEVELQLGGGSDSTYSGGPLQVKAYVKKLTDGKYHYKGRMHRGLLMWMGKAAVVEIAGNTVIIASMPKQHLDLEVFRSHGICPEEQKILVTKSAVHYRASYGTVAREMIALALPGYASPLPERMIYHKWKGQ